jgi:hypothetical protein
LAAGHNVAARNTAAVHDAQGSTARLELLAAKRRAANSKHGDALSN